MVMMLETLVEMEIPPEVTLAEFPPPILAESGGVFVSVVFWRPLPDGGRGSLYIGVFRSSGVRRRKNRGDRTAEEEKRCGGAGRAPGPSGPSPGVLALQMLLVDKK